MTVLRRLAGGLIASVQLPHSSPLGTPEAIASLALAALDAGAAGLRIESVANIRSVRMRTTVPIIGILKRAYEGFEPYITPTIDDVRSVLAAGAEIVAFDATDRPRPDGSTLEEAIAEIHAAGALAMADCALAADGARAHAAGADVLATTLHGYTAQTSGATLPNLALVRELATFGAFTICEGGIADPHAGSAALAAGADAIVVGTAITADLGADAADAVRRRTRAFADAVRGARRGSHAS